MAKKSVGRTQRRASKGSGDSEYTPINIFRRRSHNKKGRIEEKPFGEVPTSSSSMSETDRQEGILQSDVSSDVLKTHYTEFKTTSYSPQKPASTKKHQTPITPGNTSVIRVPSEICMTRIGQPVQVLASKYGQTKHRKLSDFWSQAKEQIKSYVSSDIQLEILHIVSRQLMIAADRDPDADDNLFVGTKHANSSMISFERALQAFTQKQSISPYIWSKLIVNQDGLGKSLTLFVSQVSPGELDQDALPLNDIPYYHITFKLRLTSTPVLDFEKNCYEALCKKFCPHVLADQSWIDTHCDKESMPALVTNQDVYSSEGAVEKSKTVRVLDFSHMGYKENQSVKTQVCDVAPSGFDDMPFSFEAIEDRGLGFDSMSSGLDNEPFSLEDIPLSPENASLRFGLDDEAVGPDDALFSLKNTPLNNDANTHTDEVAVKVDVLSSAATEGRPSCAFGALFSSRSGKQALSMIELTLPKLG